MLYQFQYKIIKKSNGSKINCVVNNINGEYFNDQIENKLQIKTLYHI